jgi:hypothetical protein
VLAQEEETMQTGLLWFDNDPSRGLAAKVEDAARRYREKFGLPPDTCYVCEAALQGRELTVTLPGVQGRSLRVLPASNVLAHHFWVGIEDQGASQLG